MFFTKNKPTEPICFIFFKKLCSLFLIIILIWYTIEQFSDFSHSISKPKIILSNQQLLSNNPYDDNLVNNINVVFCHLEPININDDSCNIITYDSVTYDSDYHVIPGGNCNVKRNFTEFNST